MTDSLQGNPLFLLKKNSSIYQGDADTDFVLSGMKEDGVQVSTACPRSNLFSSSKEQSFVILIVTNLFCPSLTF